MMTLINNYIVKLLSCYAMNKIKYRVVSSIFLIVQILVHPHFDLEATEPVPQTALELINNHLISVQQQG